jgi:tRNA-2-methylthio-N6-dimethylallyladenosine synthase
LGRKYLIETFGCQMNFHDSERLAGLLESKGYEATSDETAADVFVINTCSVRERAEDKLYSRLGEIREMSAERSASPLVAVTGCVAQQEGPAILRRHPGVDVIVGTQAMHRLPELLEESRAAKVPFEGFISGWQRVDIDPHEEVSFPLGLVKHSDPVRAWVTIIEGCNEFCSFCVVPYTRGNERMRPVGDILSEVQAAADSGRREVQLLGQIVNHYLAPDDPSCDFAELLARVSRVAGIARVRFASPHPRHVGDRLIHAIRDLPNVCKHLHMPVQSGSDAVLARMRRRYTRQEYLDLVERMRVEVPGIALSTDVIVGFPGETDEDFSLTLDLVRRVRFQSMYSFKYSPRPNTLASKRMADDVPEAEKTRRILALQRLQRDNQIEMHQDMVGRVFDVLPDSVSRRRASDLAGRTTGNAIVNFVGSPELIGRVVEVRIIEAGPNSLRGELVSGGRRAD